MIRLIRRIGFCFTLVCLIWGGTMIADLVQPTDNAPEQCMVENMDEKKQALKQEIRETIDVYIEKAKEVVAEVVIAVDRVIDHVIEVAGIVEGLENIFSAG